MFSGKNQSGQAPTAFGSMLQASTYGMTIPVIYGRTISPALAIWANNLRQGGSTKKFKQLKKGITAYVENIDFLLGKNPILGTLQFYVNNGKYPLNFISYAVTAGLTRRIQVGDFGGLPDPDFYAVIAVTVTQTYSQTFNDYGSGGSRTITGSYEIPLWNQAISGPDPTENSGYRNWPYVYNWKPGDGPYIAVDAFGDALLLRTITIYYAQLSSATLPATPLSKLRLHFEARLGDGDEYDDFISEQIIYDEYAGIGSDAIDLGSSGAIPSIKPEVQGKFGLYPSGDCDFVDIIEDVIKSGITQAAIGGSVGFGATQHGVGCYDLPGCIQQKLNADTESFTHGPQTYNIPVTEGNYLIAIGFTDGLDPGPVTVSDSLGNTWSPLLSTINQPAWYAKANASGICVVTFGGLGFDWHTALFEVAGVDTLDSISIGSADTGEASITTTNTHGWPGYLLSVGFYSNGANVPSTIPKWSNLLAATIYGRPGDTLSMQERTVYSPGTYSIKLPAGLLGHCIIAFKGSTAPDYPRPGGDFLDQPSADLTRLQCRAGGLWGSLSMTSQKACSEWIADLVTAANCAPVYSGFQLKLIPRSEVSAVGNGAVYVAPTAAGPVADLDADKGDFIGETPIQCVRKARTDLDTVLQMQHMNRNSDYQQVVTTEADPAGIALYGTRKKDPIVNNAIQDVAVAQRILRIMTRRRNYVDPLAYKFKLNARWGLLEAMDLVTITDRQQGIFKVPVRLKSVDEDDKFENDCEAEPFIYGISAPQTIAVTNPSSYRPSPDVQVGSGINPPIIFEPTPRLAQQTSPAQIWCAVSCPDPHYGGCIPMISTDGGLSYHLVSDAPVLGPAMQATVGSDSFQNWPAGTDPDTANNLFVSFSGTLPNPVGTLPDFSATARDKFQYPCYVGFNNKATLDAEFLTGDASQITELGVLFSDPTILNALPSDASIINIFPMLFMEAIGSTVVTSVFSGTGITPTSGGALVQTITGPISAPFPTGGGAGVGTSLAGQEIRYNLKLNTTGPGASGKVVTLGWAIYYTSATPFIDPLALLPFGPPAGTGMGWAIPKTIATGMVGSGTNATISAFGGIAPAGIPYELMTYNKATLLGPGIYELMATGSGNELRRGVFGAPSPGVGMNHPPGSPFALLDPGGAGLVKINMDPAWIGVQLWFKFLPFNTFGGSLGSAGNATAYPYTPTGIPGNIGPAQGFLVDGQ